MSNESINARNELNAKRRDTRALVKAIENVLDNLRSMCGDDPDYYSDPVADVQIWTGPRAKREGADVVLTFNGAGYDYLSLYADYPQVADKYREQIRKAAGRLGYSMEDINDRSVGFYP